MCIRDSLWGWMGLVYHIIFFLEINRAALYFGIAFLGAGMVFLLTGVYGTRLAFEFPHDSRATAGIALIGYSLGIYPLLSLWLGAYPAVPTFGAPCPTTCLLYTSDAADERSSVDLGGRRI